MDDLIRRQAAIEAVYQARKKPSGDEEWNRIYNALSELPPAQPNVHDRNVGEWNMFELITSTWYGKQCYFVEGNGIVYSRVSCKHMSVDEAIKEFLGRIGDNG